MTTSTYEDILFEQADGVATIVMKVMKPIRSRTVEEMIDAFRIAGWNKDVGVIVLTSLPGTMPDFRTLVRF